MRGLRRTTLLVYLLARQSGAQELTQNWLALNQAGCAAFDADRYAEASAYSEASWPLALTPEQRAMTLGDIGQSLSGVGRDAEGLTKLEQALAAWRSIDPSGHYAAEIAVTVAYYQASADRLAEAERALRSALDARPRENLDNAAILNAFGGLPNEQARFLQAHETFEAALKLSSAADDKRINALTGWEMLRGRCVNGDWRLPI